MDLKLTEQQQMLRDATRRFTEQRLIPHAEAAEHRGSIAPELLAELAAMGYCGIGTPEQYGGAGLDAVSYALMISELSYGDASVGVTVSVTNSLTADPILMFGTEQQKQRYLPPLARGEVWGGFALTEPSAGTDSAGTRTTAIPDGDHYVVNGTKNFITNGGFADTFVVFVRGDTADKHAGISAFIVEKGTPGFSVGKHENKLGIRASSTTELVFEDCRLPKTNLLGDWGQGFKVAMKTLDNGRIGIAAQAHGIAARAFDLALAYAKEREQFDRPLATFQHVQFRLADMATDLEAARLLLMQAAWEKDQKLSHSKAAAMAKLFCSEAAHRICHQALQIHGGYGYIKEYEIERLYRDQRITEIYEGTSEAMRMVIAGALLK
ncbi:MAG TPA: acyl-CoA dehydrogenase family protein [Candidatus Krumholzibacteria bacterium]|nr:acyl-CoA dehydrogenase family protein [Candidatus Krumholzibacteria bacterium]HPD70174.1 acyl-CoA dehydrogenase family protein [Candidatus Krumholzibacteria bacterium]HRY40126.1 acyl-CoA dehydrogenase family protein [Candidatus Krumholzibacteria bacterium]